MPSECNGPSDIKITSSHALLEDLIGDLFDDVLEYWGTWRSRHEADLDVIFAVAYVPIFGKDHVDRALVQLVRSEYGLGHISVDAGTSSLSVNIYIYIYIKMTESMPAPSHGTLPCSKGPVYGQIVSVQTNVSQSSCAAHAPDGQMWSWAAAADPLRAGTCTYFTSGMGYTNPGTTKTAGCVSGLGGAEDESGCTGEDVLRILGSSGSVTCNGVLNNHLEPYDAEDEVCDMGYPMYRMTINGPTIDGCSATTVQIASYSWGSAGGPARDPAKYGCDDTTCLAAEQQQNEYLKNTCLYIEASSTYEGMNTGPGPKEAYGTSKVKVYQCQKPDLEDLEPIETACKSWHKDAVSIGLCVNAMMDKVCKYGSAYPPPPPPGGQ